MMLISGFCFLRIYNNNGLGGDQIHYIVLINSIIEDLDLNVKNNYQQLVYSEKIEPHIPLKQFNVDSPEWYSLHNPGLAILGTPFVLVNGQSGLIFCMVLLGILFLSFTYLWALKVTESKTGAIICTLSLASSVFFLALNGYIFPNILCGVLFLLAFLLLETKNTNKGKFLLLGLILGIGPWVHVKLLLSFGIIGVISIIQIIFNKNSNKDKVLELLLLCVFPIILLALFEIKLFQWYGVLIPSQTFAGDIILKVSPLKSLMANFFDSTKGIFTNNPVFLLIFAGLPLWLKKAPKQLFKILLIIAPSVFLQLTFLDWWGGWSPTGRYWMDIIPIFLPAIGFLFIYWHKLWMKIIFISLFVTQLFYSFIYIYYKIGWVWSGIRNPIFVKIKEITGLSIDGIMVHFKPELRIAFHKEALFLWITIVVSLIIFGFFLSQRREKNY